MSLYVMSSTKLSEQGSDSTEDQDTGSDYRIRTQDQTTGSEYRIRLQSYGNVRLWECMKAARACRE